MMTREGSLVGSALTSPNMGSVLSAGDRMNLRMVNNNYGMSGAGGSNSTYGGAGGSDSNPI